MLSAAGETVWLHDRVRVEPPAAGRRGRVWGVMLDVTRRRKSEHELQTRLDELDRAHEDRRLLLSATVSAGDRERRRIAERIHQDALQVMSAVGMHLRSLRTQLADPAAIDGVEETVRVAVTNLRDALTELWSPVLGGEGPGEALRRALEQLEADTGIRHRFEDRLGDDLPEEAGMVLHRITRDILGTVRRHQKAGRVDVLLGERGRGAFGRIVLADVCGIPEDDLGVLAAHEWSELVGGWCRIDAGSTPQVTVEFWIPAFVDSPPRG
jgi:two-component system, NarL family, sensor kinase